jgi:hypothetical protein
MAKKKLSRKKNDGSEPCLAPLSISVPAAGGNGNVVVTASGAKLCCAQGQAPAVPNYYLSEVRGYILDGANQAANPSYLGDPTKYRVAELTGNRYWRFFNQSALPVPNPTGDGSPKTLHIYPIFQPTAGFPPTPYYSGDESSTFYVLNVRSCPANCP